jgi:hypothetical protein
LYSISTQADTEKDIQNDMEFGGQRASLEANLLQHDGVEPVQLLLIEDDDPPEEETSTLTSFSSRIQQTALATFQNAAKTTTKRRPKVIVGLAGQRISVANAASCERAYWAIRNSQLYFALQNSFQYPTAPAYIQRLCQEAAQVQRPVKTTGGVAVITHVTKYGSSYHVAQELALIGFHLILLGKSPSKCQQIEALIRREATRRQISKANLKVYKIHYDPNSLRAVRKAAHEASAILESNYQGKLDLLLHNPAGVIADYGTTRDGIEVNVGRNFVAAHVLTETLLPYLRKAATVNYKPRIIHVSSVGHCNGTDFNFERFLSRPQEGGAPEWTFQKDDDTTKKTILSIDMDATLTAAKTKMAFMTNQLFQKNSSNSNSNSNKDPGDGPQQPEEQPPSSTTMKPKLQLPSFALTNPLRTQEGFAKTTFPNITSSWAGRFSTSSNDKLPPRQGSYVPPTMMVVESSKNEDDEATVATIDTMDHQENISTTQQQEEENGAHDEQENEMVDTSKLEEQNPMLLVEDDIDSGSDDEDLEQAEQVDQQEEHMITTEYSNSQEQDQMVILEAAEDQEASVAKEENSEKKENVEQEELADTEKSQQQQEEVADEELADDDLLLVVEKGHEQKSAADDESVTKVGEDSEKKTNATMDATEESEIRGAEANHEEQETGVTAETTKADKDDDDVQGQTSTEEVDNDVEIHDMAKVSEETNMVGENYKQETSVKAEAQAEPEKDDAQDHGVVTEEVDNESELHDTAEDSEQAHVVDENDKKETAVAAENEGEKGGSSCIDATSQTERSKIASIADTTAFAQVKMYYRSKMASIADAIALAREEPSLAVLSVYPGSVESRKNKTALGIADSMYQTTFKAFNLNPSQAARSSLRAALDPDINTTPSLQGGVYLHCDGNPWTVDNPTVVNPATGEPYSLDEYATQVRTSVQKLCHKLIKDD